MKIDQEIFRAGFSKEGDAIFEVKDFYKITFKDKRRIIAYCIETLADFMMYASTQKNKSTKVKFKKAKK